MRETGGATPLCASHQRNGQALKVGSNRITPGADDDGGCGERHRPEPHRAGIDHRLFERQAVAEPQLDEVHQDDRVTHHDPGTAMKPIIDVAVKNAPIAACAGRMPTSVEKGIAAMISSGVLNDWNQPDNKHVEISTSTAAKASPRSLNTSMVMCHSPSTSSRTRRCRTAASR